MASSAYSSFALSIPLCHSNLFLFPMFAFFQNVSSFLLTNAAPEILFKISGLGLALICNRVPRYSTTFS